MTAPPVLAIAARNPDRAPTAADLRVELDRIDRADRIAQHRQAARAAIPTRRPA